MNTERGDQPLSVLTNSFRGVHRFADISSTTQRYQF